MRWVEDQLAHLEWTISKLTWLYNRKPPSARPAKRPSKRQDDPSGDTTFSLFLQYLDRLQDKVIECIRLVSNGAGQSSPLDRVANSSMVDGRQKPVTKEKRQLVVPAMIGPLLQKFEMVFDSVSVPSDDAKYEKRSQDEQNLEKRQMVTPGINGAALPPGLVDVIQKIGDAAQPLPAQVKNPDGSTHPFPVEAGKDHSHAWDNPPGKLGPKPSNLPAVAAELKAYLDNLEAETQKPTPIQRADTTPPLRPKDPRPPKQIKSTPLPTPKEDTWTDGVFPAQVPTPSTTTKPPVDPNADDVAAVLPYFLGPGPVIPSGVSVNWPGPVHGGPKPQQVDNLENMPQVVNDLTPEDEESVKKWFADEAERQKEELVNSDGKDGTGE